MQKKVRKIVSTLFILLLMVVVLYQMFQDSLNQIVLHIKELSVLSLVFILICSMLYQLIEGVILTKVIRKHKQDFPIIQGIQGVLQGCFYRGISFGSGTQAGQVFFLSGKGIQPSQSMSAITLSYAMHKIGAFFYVIICVVINYKFFYHNYKPYMNYIMIGCLINFLIVLFLILMVVSKRFHSILIYLLEKILKHKKHKDLHMKIKTQLKALSVDAYIILGDKKLLIQVVLLELTKFTCWYVIPYITLIGLRAENISFSGFEIISVTVFMNGLVGAIPMPSGIMSTELVFTALFSVFIGKAKAGATMIIYRFTTYIVPFLLGTLTWIDMKSRKKLY